MTTPISLDDLLSLATQGRLAEHRHPNVELKSNWSIEHGRKLSALANRIDQLPKWLIIGVNDDGILLNKTEPWARHVEQTVSQQINQHLDPTQACSLVVCKSIGTAWIVIVRVQNPGDVVYWSGRVYEASGSTISELAPDEVLRLRIQLPGLTDFSHQRSDATADPGLVGSFQTRVALRGRASEGSHLGAGQTDEVIRALGIGSTQTERILFGNCAFRLVRYDSSGDPVQNDRMHGTYRLLTDDFIQRIQDWGRLQPRSTDEPFSDQVLREALTNAVAHAAYFEDDGDIIIEQYSDRITIGNLCVRESAYFANRWFSRSHKTVNSLLMETLRVAGHVDELGRGKSLIFTASIRSGKRAPQVEVEKAGRYDRWKLTLFARPQDPKLLRLRERCEAIYRNDQQALIAFALVLWRERPLSDIRNFVDGDFARQFGEVLSDLRGPIFYNKDKDHITLRRWAKVLLGEGKDSKALSPVEEKHLCELAYRMRTEFFDGYISPKDLRDLGAMGGTPSEQVLSSGILRRWKTQGIVRPVKRGLYKFNQKRKGTSSSLEGLLDLFRTDLIDNEPSK